MASQHQPVVDRHDMSDTDRLIVQSLARLDGKALGIAVGLLFGLLNFLATNYLVFKGGDIIGPNLALLSQFFVGYEVTLVGSAIGLIYGFIAGFVIGWLIAALRNAFLSIYLRLVKVRSSFSTINDYIDNP